MRANRCDQRCGAGECADRGEDGRRGAGHECMRDSEAARENLQHHQRRHQKAERGSDRDLAEVELRMRVRLALEAADQR